MRALGIDFGLKRVGLAISNPEGTMAFPRSAIVRTTKDKFFKELLDVIDGEGVEHIVVGLPLALDGSDTETTRQARNFAQRLGRRTPLPIELVDERLTSAEAEERLKEAGLCGKKRKARLDSQAAVIILETWLATNRPCAT
ncbi:putative holliday junction resolvase [Paucidesulfovibrio gracilis DSM 16080]|uniref:Putative pre-16S rRNA nuclease n=1 Tax=Paucidesulfovibrio gracilis DSM 16080 TaxID=1121449 RepID=A0A1T4W9H7_9BACT|nr:Holliday junction resolvase RuvX [Paucidesulfovibrio gracilis]SKA73361.1 putative holliday junction resolvase [Paucidesulfovibrio gracilis DSM 16080]